MKALVLHFNPDCPHRGTKLERMRVLVRRGEYARAVEEIARLAHFTKEEQLVVDAHAALCGLHMQRYSAQDADALLSDIIRRSSRHELIVDLRSMRIRHLRTYLPGTVINGYMATFFDGIDKNETTNAFRLVAQASLESDKLLALGYLRAALRGLATVERPCLKESIARYAVDLFLKLGDPPAAVHVLRSVGVEAVTSLADARDGLLVSDAAFKL